ncbi:MAG TPA: hypothetical protein VMB66_13670 [Candidatus Acidoferrales bacterium]|nr:hypothetical protein [Candidatus Acidoferrales bacterium]
MKITLTILVFLVLFSAAAFGQATVGVSAQPQIVQFAEHPLHAEPHDMATETPIAGGGSYSYAQGEQPLWQFGPVSEAKPLGDVARELRKQKLVAKRAEIVFEKQGS